MPSLVVLRRAARIVNQGGVIAYPTEAVYGLGCDPGNKVAVQRILDLKQRPITKGLILVAADFAQLTPWLAPLTETDQAELMTTWPGPNTWLLPVNNANNENKQTPRWLTGNHTTLAVRVSDHPLVRALCLQVGSALVSTSANIAGRLPARNTLKVRRQFSSQRDYIVPGAVGEAAKPSVIRDWATGRVIRP